MTDKSLHNSQSLATSLDEVQETLEPLTSDTARTAIFLDLDGTLAPIMPKPEDVAVPPAISKLVRKLAHQYLAVTAVSGRPATEAKRIIGNSDISYIGNHGFETMLPGRAVVVCEEAQPYIPKIRELLEFGRSLEEIAEMGIWVEDKTATISFHYRRSPDPEQALAYIQERIFPQIEAMGLSASRGRMVIEVRPPVAIDKGVAVGQLIDRLGVSKALYAGDDTTDIDALRELRRRREELGQTTVGVGVMSDEMPSELPDYADILVDRISGMELVLQILAREEL